MKVNGFITDDLKPCLLVILELFVTY